MYEDMISILPKSKSGKIQFKKDLYLKALQSAKNEKDIEHMIKVVSDFVGNGCLLSNESLDNLLLKSIELNCPNKLAPLLKNHRAIGYYPDPKLISQIVKLYYDNNDYENLKIIYNAIARR